MKVHCDEGVATHIGPEPCAGVREDVGEASAGGHIGQPSSREIVVIPGADAVHLPEGKMDGRANNSFFFASEFVALHGIAKIIGETDLIKAQTKLMNLVMPVSEEMSHLIHAIFAVLWQKYFGTELLAERRIDIKGAPGFLDVWVPFFVEIPAEPPAPQSAP